MICGACGAENRAGRRFCLECGVALARVCPTCGAANEPGARFCGDCGTALALEGGEARPGGLAAAAAVSETPGSGAQRRIVSVLFADLVGFTPFAEERDPEEVRDVLSRYAEISREVVQRYGGSVEKFIGDAVMAAWGTPVAHEDDAERAVRAGLELIDAVHVLGPGIQARAGILTGEAAVSLGATDQGLLAGDLVNTAARLQSIAPPGAVLVGEATMRATEASLAFEEAGEQLLKGKAAPVQAWRALRVVAQRRGAGRAGAVETPFVGRVEEFRVLRDLLHLSGRDPRTRLVSVTGPAGIGKSRLAWELEKYIDGVVEDIYWHRGRCPAYGDGVTFWALGEMVRRRCGLAEGADEMTTRARVAATVAEHVTDEGERAWIESALAILLGVDPDPQVSRELLFAAWRRFFESVASGGTTVLVFEDLQWADTALMDFIDHLLDWSKGAPLLVVTLARPEIFDRRPDWGAGRKSFTAIALEPLSDAAMRELLAGLVPDLPDEAARQVVDRADGIPLYAVETVRMLLADGRLEAVEGRYRPTRELGDLGVPETLRSLITSRLDALDPADRSLLQHASVLGDSFGIDSLAALVGDSPDALQPRVHALVRRELLTLEADPRSPERGQYGFVQSFTREVAYATLSRPDRRSRHLAAARHFESTAGDELAAVLAAHYVAAYQASAPGAEADAVAAQARVALRGAADRAAALGGHDQAATYLGQSLEVTREASERAALMERIAYEALLAGHYDQGEASARAAAELYREVGDHTGTARSRGILGTILIHASRVTEAIAELERAVSDLPDDADPAALADAYTKLARGRYRNLQPDAARDAADRALIIAQHHNLRRTVAEAMVSKGTALNFLKRPHEALALIRAGIELARREGDVPTALRGMANIGGLVAAEDGAEAATHGLRAAIDLARVVGDLGQIVWLTGNLAWDALLPGRPLAPAIAEIEEVLSMRLEPADRVGLLQRRLMLRTLLGEDIALELEAVVQEVRQLSDPQLTNEAEFINAMTALARRGYRSAAAALVELGERDVYETSSIGVLCASLADDPDLARTMLARMEAIAGSDDIDAATRSAARSAVAALGGRADEALAGFREATGRLRALGIDFNVALIGMAMVATLGPENAEARAACEFSLQVFGRMGAQPLAAQARDLLATRGPVTLESPAQPSAAPAGRATADSHRRAG